MTYADLLNDLEILKVGVKELIKENE